MDSTDHRYAYAYTRRRYCLIFDAGPDGNGNYRDKRALARYSPGVIKGLLSFFFPSDLPGEWQLARSIEISNLIIRYRRSFPRILANSVAFVRHHSLSSRAVLKEKYLDAISRVFQTLFLRLYVF